MSFSPAPDRQRRLMSGLGGTNGRRPPALVIVEIDEILLSPAATDEQVHEGMVRRGELDALVRMARNHPVELITYRGRPSLLFYESFVDGPTVWRAAGKLDEASRSDPATWSELVSLDRDQPDLADIALITARPEGLEQLAAQGVRIITVTPGDTPSASDQVSSIDELALLLFGSHEGD